MSSSKYDVSFLLLLLFSLIMRGVINYFYGPHISLLYFVESVALIIMLRLVMWRNEHISWYKIGSVLLFGLILFIILAG